MVPLLVALPHLKSPPQIKPEIKLLLFVPETLLTKVLQSAGEILRLTPLVDTPSLVSFVVKVGEVSVSITVVDTKVDNTPPTIKPSTPPVLWPLNTLVKNGISVTTQRQYTEGHTLKKETP